MHIKASSKQHRKCHNVILESELNACIHSKTLSKKEIEVCFKKTEDPDFLSIHKDNITKSIIFAIDLATIKPYRTYIFTTQQKAIDYENNPHLKDVKSVIVKSENDAIAI
ncbi:MAG: hypothetical protein WC595_07040, partial [Candidatus Nanoarchaeia archaeon]